MRISGATQTQNSFLESLDARLLVSLAADLLAVRGHTDIKIVDGPGDGGRDLHSLDCNSRRHLTQCKFHRRIQTSISSKQAAELPLAMIKLDYRCGLLLTNSKLSPQAKREFLDDFEDLELEFLEGNELADEVLRSILLRALWFERQSLARVAYTVSFAVVLRDLRTDRPLSLKTMTGRIPLRSSRSELAAEAELQIASTPCDVFAPYRAPSRKTIHEGWLSRIQAGEILLRGVARISSIDRLKRRAASVVLRRASKIWADLGLIALRLSTSSLTPLWGREAGSRIPLDDEATTIICDHGGVVEEFDWINPLVGSVWHPAHRVSASVAEWARWYNYENDLCVDLNLLSPPSQNRAGMAAEQREYEIRQWNESVFAFLDPTKLDSLLAGGQPPPSNVFSWPDGRAFCCWLVGTNSPMRHFLVEPEGLDESDDLHGAQADSNSKLTEPLYRALQAAGAEILTPHRARHAYGFLAHDPWPSLDKVIYRTVDLGWHFSEIPSPIDPRSRRVEFVVAWLLHDSKTRKWEGQISGVAGDLATQLRDRFTLNLEYDMRTNQGTYLIAFFAYVGEESLDRTEAFLASLLGEVGTLCLKLEASICEIIPNARRATAKYWKDEFTIDFDPRKS